MQRKGDSTVGGVQDPMGGAEQHRRAGDAAGRAITTPTAASRSVPEEILVLALDVDALTLRVASSPEKMVAGPLRPCLQFLSHPGI